MMWWPDDLTERVRFWLEHPGLAYLGVAHWDIKVSIVDEPHGKKRAKAAILSMSHYDEAKMEFSESWLDEADDREMDVTIVHELIHAVFRDLEEVQHSICLHLTPAVEEAYHDRLDHEVEGVIDRTARAIVACVRGPKVVQLEP